MLYFRYVKMQIKSLLQHRASMWLNTLGQFLVSAFAFLGMYLLFQRFQTIAGWTFGEAALCFAVVSMAFALTECFARGFDLFSLMVKSGDFDRLLLRPRGTILQVLGSSFELQRLGRLAESVAVLVIALSVLDATWNFAKVVTLILMIFSGVAIFTGIFIMGGALSFVTVEGIEVVNIFTHGGREIAQYPLTIYPKWVMQFFTFVIPFGSFNYLPLLFVTGRAAENVALYMLSPLLGVVFLLPCILVWHLGVRKYLSTGN
jgi:ABC-2 type transport system permease protein